MIKIGTAGLGGVKEAFETLEEYNRLGVKICEIAFTHSVYIKPEDAVKIGKKAGELGIILTIHAPYFVNLNAEDKEKREASKKRILDSCRIGEILGAKRVVFHPGFYGDDREKAYQTIKSEVEDMMKEIKKKELKITIAAETMGKINVFGSIEEISRLAMETGCDFCIDFAHILSRDKKVDYKKIEEAFPQKRWHCHFSAIEYGEKGEKRHLMTEEKQWRELLANLPKDREITIVSETPTPILGAVMGLGIYNKLTR